MNGPGRRPPRARDDIFVALRNLDRPRILAGVDNAIEAAFEGEDWNAAVPQRRAADLQRHALYAGRLVGPQQLRNLDENPGARRRGPPAECAARNLRSALFHWPKLHTPSCRCPNPTSRVIVQHNSRVFCAMKAATASGVTRRAGPASGSACAFSLSDLLSIYRSRLLFPRSFFRPSQMSRMIPLTQIPVPSSMRSPSQPRQLSRERGRADQRSPVVRKASKSSFIVRSAG